MPRTARIVREEERIRIIEARVRQWKDIADLAENLREWLGNVCDMLITLQARVEVLKEDAVKQSDSAKATRARYLGNGVNEGERQ